MNDLDIYFETHLVMSKIQDFIDKYYSFAKKAEAETKVPALFSTSQSALETGWGGVIVGNMMFGVKDRDGINGNEQLLTTTEYHNSPNVKYPVILSITEIIKGKRWKYKIKDWFRKYPTPYESFLDHGKFLIKNKRYAKAFQTTNPYDFAKEVCRAGYATDPDYEKSILRIMSTINELI